MTLGLQTAVKCGTLLQEVAKCQTTDAHLSLGEVCTTYTRLKKQCREEYIMYNLAAAALSQVTHTILPAFTCGIST